MHVFAVLSLMILVVRGANPAMQDPGTLQFRIRDDREERHDSGIPLCLALTFSALSVAALGVSAGVGAYTKQNIAISVPFFELLPLDILRDGRYMTVSDFKPNDLIFVCKKDDCEYVSAIEIFSSEFAMLHDMSELLEAEILTYDDTLQYSKVESVTPDTMVVGSDCQLAAWGSLSPTSVIDVYLRAGKRAHVTKQQLVDFSSQLEHQL